MATKIITTLENSGCHAFMIGGKMFFSYRLDMID